MVNFNGNLLSEQTMFLNEKNRAMCFGDALSEIVLTIDGKLVFWEDHYLKLMASMRILRMEIPMNFTMEILEEQMLQCLVVNKSNHRRAFVDFTVFRKGNDGLLPASNEIDYCIAIREIEEPSYQFRKGNFEVELFHDFYVNTGLLSNLNSSNKLIRVLGSIYAKENDYESCLLLNYNKMVVSSLNGNLFLVTGNKVKTPALDEGCIDRIIRRKIIKIVEESAEFEIEQTVISPFELQKVDELFICNIENGIIPIAKYRKKDYEISVSKSILEKLNGLIDEKH